MIQALSIRNFKCFSALDVELPPLTLFTGFNAGGKSTTLQTLLLLEQTLRGPFLYPHLMLNGPIVTLGTSADVLHSSPASAKTMSIGVTAKEETLRWRFSIIDRSLTVVDLDETDRAGTAKYSGKELFGIRPGGVLDGDVISALESLVYLSAARQVESEVYPSAFGAELPKADVGPIGQYAAWWLHELGDEIIEESRRHPDAGMRETVRQQVNAWIGELFPGAEANSRTIEQTNLVRLELRSGPTSEWVRPSNIGYGISYAFPIVVAGLCAEIGQTVILDSPEAHLHPRAQSRIGRFLTKMAGAGVQMLVETHSDHLLNGVRIAVRDGLIKPDDTAIYFFTGNKEAQVIRLFVDRNGTISGFPNGFFDQAELDLANLAGWNT